MSEHREICKCPTCAQECPPAIIRVIQHEGDVGFITTRFAIIPRYPKGVWLEKWHTTQAAAHQFLLDKGHEGATCLTP